MAAILPITHNCKRPTAEPGRQVETHLALATHSSVTSEVPVTMLVLRGGMMMVGAMGSAGPPTSERRMKKCWQPQTLTHTHTESFPVYVYTKGTWPPSISPSPLSWILLKNTRLSWTMWLLSRIRNNHLSYNHLRIHFIGFKMLVIVPVIKVHYFLDLCQNTVHIYPIQAGLWEILPCSYQLVRCSSSSAILISPKLSKPSTPKVVPKKSL